MSGVKSQARPTRCGSLKKCEVTPNGKIVSPFFFTMGVHHDMKRVLFFMMSVGLVLVFFVILSLGSSISRKRLSLEKRLALAAVASFLAALAKILVDYVRAVNSCVTFSSENNCGFDAWNILLCLDGILTGLLITLSLHVVHQKCVRRRRQDPCDATAAVSMSIDDEEQTLAFREAEDQDDGQYPEENKESSISSNSSTGSVRIPAEITTS